MRTRTANGLVFGCIAGLALALAAGVPHAGAEDEGQLPERVAGTLRLVGEPGGLPDFRVVRAFPALTFERPVIVVAAPDGSGNLFVGEQAGTLRVFENEPGARKATKAFDISKQVSRAHNEAGLLGLAFHPDFEKNRHLYVAYTSADARETVVSRFTASSSRRHVRERSEELLLRHHQPTGRHNGGCLAFGPDGHLYVGFGDGGEQGDESGHAQNLRNWLGAILRLDVDADERYAVPPDNPFAAVQHVRPEIYAYGFADPRRFSFDPVTGDLWVGEAGAGRYEEIDVVEAGGNYGWNLFEGNERVRKGTSLTPLQPPVVALTRDEARHVIGGVVYRGARLPGLVGAYVFGDHASGALYALRYDGEDVTERRRIGQVPGVTHVGVDADGELLMTALDGGVYTLEPAAREAPRTPFPQRLSDTGLFTDVAALTPHPSLVPYTVATPLWSDGAGKTRYVMLPDLERVRVQKDGTYAFPDGTIFVKHFHLGPVADPGRRLETRLLIKRDGGWGGYTYVWRPDHSDAFLIDGRVETEIEHQGASHPWTFPSRVDCTSCHTLVANEILGFRREQLDVPMTYGDVTTNQLDALEAMGVFEGTNRRKDTWPAWDEEGDLDRQVRAYLDANCAMCHQPDGPGNANIDLRYDTPLRKAGVIGKRPGMWDLDVYDARLLAPGHPDRSLLLLRMQRTDLKGMPTIAHNVPDEKALARIEAWIEGMTR